MIDLEAVWIDIFLCLGPVGAGVPGVQCPPPQIMLTTLLLDTPIFSDPPTSLDLNLKPGFGGRLVLTCKKLHDYYHCYLYRTNPWRTLWFLGFWPQTPPILEDIRIWKLSMQKLNCAENGLVQKMGTPKIGMCKSWKLQIMECPKDMECPKYGMVQNMEYEMKACRIWNVKNSQKCWKDNTYLNQKVSLSVILGHY